MPNHLLARAAALVVFAGTTLMCAPAASAEPLPRSHFVLPSAISVDPQTHRLTLPLHRGTAAGRTVWYIITDSSNKADAQRRQAVYAPALANVGIACPSCVANVSEASGGFVYPGAPDFAAARHFTPGPTGFPPAAAAPGAEAGDAYTPFVRVAGGAIVNAPIVATGDGDFDVVTHRNTADRVLAIDTARKTVTLLAVDGFANGKHVIYISTEASDPGAATIERATYVKHLGGATGVPIYVIANGAKQGLAYDALRGRLNDDATLATSPSLLSPLNVLATFPTGSTAAAYTPLWAANVGVYAKSALAAHANGVVTSATAFTSLAGSNAITSPDGKPLGPAGFVVNCPVVAYVDGAP